MIILVGLHVIFTLFGFWGWANLGGLVECFVVPLGCFVVLYFVEVCCLWRSCLGYCWLAGCLLCWLE